MTDYKSYSLEQLKNWIHDSITSGEASPHEIYSTIKNAVQEEYNIHKDLSQRCFGLLELLSGHRPVNFDDYMQPCGHSNTEGIVGAYGNDVITFNTNSVENNMPNSVDKVNKWILSVEIDAASGEYYLQLPDDLLDSLKWKEGDTLEYNDNGDGSFSVKKV